MPNEKTHAAATVRGALPLGQMTLIGTLTGAKPPRALLRLPSGTVRTVSVGDTVGGQTLTAIDDARVVLTEGSDSQVLTLAGRDTAEYGDAEAA